MGVRPSLVGAVGTVALIAAIRSSQRCLFLKRSRERLLRMAQTPQDPTTLEQFRDSYGRLCHLTCKALREAHENGAGTERYILEAFEGAGGSMAPVLYQIRSAYVAANADLKRTAEAFPMEAITKVALQVRRAHEGEWMVEIPASVTNAR